MGVLYKIFCPDPLLLDAADSTANKQLSIRRADRGLECWSILRICYTHEIANRVILINVATRASLVQL